MKTSIITVLVATIVIAAGIAIYSSYRQKSNETGRPNETASQQSDTEIVSTPPGSENTVLIANFSFSPASIDVGVGESVTFKNSDNVIHTATADNSTFDSGAIATRESKTIKFNRPGTYAYYCKPHPYMKGTVIVK